jgi:hypothetical protein
MSLQIRQAFFRCERSRSLNTCRWYVSARKAERLDCCRDSHFPSSHPEESARGGEALYFRDPDGHLLEVVTPGIWNIY